MLTYGTKAQIAKFKFRQCPLTANLAKFNAC